MLFTDALQFVIPAGAVTRNRTRGYCHAIQVFHLLSLGFDYRLMSIFLRPTVGRLWPRACTRLLTSTTRCDHKLDTKFDMDYWVRRWKQQDLRWHLDDVHECLVQFADKLLIPGVTQHKLFVPLCGKAVDMKWLYDKGCRVVGVDIALNALEEFMAEQSLSFSRRKVGVAEVLETEDGRVSLWCCGLFDFPKLYEERGFDGIWDRGSFVAVNFSEREAYVDLMKSLLAPNFRYLMEWMEYDGRLYGGPPKTSSPAEIEGLFGKHFTVTTLKTEVKDMTKYEGLQEGLYFNTLLSPKC